MDHISDAPVQLTTPPDDGAAAPGGHSSSSLVLFAVNGSGMQPLIASIPRAGKFSEPF